MGVIKAKWVENLSRKEKQNGFKKKKKQIWSRPTSKHPIYELPSAYAADFLNNGKLYDIT